MQNKLSWQLQAEVDSHCAQEEASKHPKSFKRWVCELEE